MKTKYSKKQIKASIAHWKKILESMDECGEKENVEEAELDEAGRGIGAAFQTLYKQVAIQLQAEEKAEMESWKKAYAEHQAKMKDIKARRAAALAEFRKAQAELNTKGIAVDVDDELEQIAANAPEA